MSSFALSTVVPIVAPVTIAGVETTAVVENITAHIEGSKHPNDPRCWPTGPLPPDECVVTMKIKGWDAQSVLNALTKLT